jgi:hypothetical protein
MLQLLVPYGKSNNLPAPIVKRALPILTKLEPPLPESFVVVVLDPVVC